MDQAINITGLNKKYGTKPALKNVSLSVKQGEIFGFLGPNGAGKTTTIRCIMDFIRPDSGSVNVFAKNAQKDTLAIKSMIGYLPADNQLYEKWNAQQHIDFYSSIKGSPAESKKLLAKLGLGPDLQVRHMSTGNRQKLGFILTFIGKPKLLILDEPTKGLDPLLQNEIYEILKRYAADGGTVFLSSHNLAEVDHLCTNVGVIRGGEIVANKSMDDIRAMKIHIVTITYNDSKNIKIPKISNVEVVNSSPGRIVLRARGGVNQLIRELGKQDLKDLEITHAPLEDVFMEYYKD